MLSTPSAIDTIDFGQSIYSGLNAELVLSGHSIQDGDCPTFSYSVEFCAPAGIGWPDRNGVLSSWVGGSQWSKSTERCGSKKAESYIVQDVEIINQHMTIT